MKGTMYIVLKDLYKPFLASFSPSSSFVLTETRSTFMYCIQAAIKTDPMQLCSNCVIFSRSIEYSIVLYLQSRYIRMFLFF